MISRILLFFKSTSSTWINFYKHIITIYTNLFKAIGNHFTTVQDWVNNQQAAFWLKYHDYYITPDPITGEPVVIYPFDENLKTFLMIHDPVLALQVLTAMGIVSGIGIILFYYYRGQRLYEQTGDPYHIFKSLWTDEHKAKAAAIKAANDAKTVDDNSNTMSFVEKVVDVVEKISENN